MLRKPVGWGDDSDSGGGGNSANTAQVSSTRCRVIKPSAVCAADMFRIAVGFLMEISSGWDMTGYPGPGGLGSAGWACEWLRHKAAAG